ADTALASPITVRVGADKVKAPTATRLLPLQFRALDIVTGQQSLRVATRQLGSQTLVDDSGDIEAFPAHNRPHLLTLRFRQIAQGLLYAQCDRGQARATNQPNFP